MKFTRRDFLKFSLLGLGASAFRLQDAEAGLVTHPRLMLVGEKDGVSIYKEPDESSAILYQRQYNDIINVYEEVIGPNGPAWNPIWYRCWGGYVFSGLLYEVRYEYQPLSEPNRFDRSTWRRSQSPTRAPCITVMMADGNHFGCTTIVPRIGSPM
jgi:hypothetical protein